MLCPAHAVAMFGGRTSEAQPGGGHFGQGIGTLRPWINEITGNLWKSLKTVEIMINQ